LAQQALSPFDPASFQPAAAADGKNDRPIHQD